MIDNSNEVVVIDHTFRNCTVRYIAAVLNTKSQSIDAWALYDTTNWSDKVIEVFVAQGMCAGQLAKLWEINLGIAIGSLNKSAESHNE